MNMNGIQSKDTATAALLEWLNKTYPGSKAAIMRRAQSGLGADETTTPAAVPWYEKVLTAAKEVIPVYYQYKTNKTVTDMQMRRAEQGLAPIDPSMYAAPPLTFQHELTANSISPDTKTALMIGGGILGAILLLPLLTRGGSSRAPARRR